MMPFGVAFCRALVAAGIGRSSVIEIGSKPAPGQEVTANLRPVFEADTYVGVDLEAGPGVELVGDGEQVHTLVGDRRFELGITFDTLEHTWNPGAMVSSLSQIVDHLALRVPFAAPIHNHPCDYWRVTPATVARWLKEIREHGFVAQDAPVVAAPGDSSPSEWPHGVYGFGTNDEALCLSVLEHMPGGITVLGYW